MKDNKKSNDARGEAYAGSATCINCHKDVFNAYKNTAHHLTSLPASKDAIKGSFNKDSNTLFYRPALKVVMEQRDSGFYQAAYIDNIEKQVAPFDIVVGSGTKGQSYLYWYGENIFQLPVSYYVPGKCWVNSPGFTPKNVNFVRNIPAGCFECHSSYIRKTATKPVGDNLYDFFDKKGVIYGIDCERCHGPAAEHVIFHENNKNEKTPKFITTAASLNRQQQLSLCAMCHSGARETIKPGFYYKPGDKITDYLSPDTSTVSLARIDVHGKQYQLLSASRCFIKTESLTCASCHNTHVPERGNLTNFSKKCMTCHEDVNHNSLTAVTSLSNTTLIGNCIDCHMPARPSAIITMNSQTRATPIPAMVRTHYISIYPDETRKFISSLK